MGKSPFQVILEVYIYIIQYIDRSKDDLWLIELTWYMELESHWVWQLPVRIFGVKRLRWGRKEHDYIQKLIMSLQGRERPWQWKPRRKGHTGLSTATNKLFPRRRGARWTGIQKLDIVRTTKAKCTLGNIKEGEKAYIVGIAKPTSTANAQSRALNQTFPRKPDRVNATPAGYHSRWTKKYWDGAGGTEAQEK